MSSRKRANSRHTKSSHFSWQQYQQLEDRKLLAVDVGLNFSEVPFEGMQPEVADVHGDIGPNHIVEVINDRYTVRNTIGQEIQSFDTEFFFGQIAGADLVIGQDGFNNDVIGNVEDVRVVFDHDSERWFVSGVVADEDGDPLPGNDVLLAISRTANPIDGYQSIQFVGDTTGTRYSSFASVGVNGGGVVITTNSLVDELNNDTSIFTIPKADLTSATPSAINMTRFENLDPAMYGNVVQFGINQTADSASTYGVGTFSSGTELSFIELTNTGNPDPVDLFQTSITVPFYTAAPNARQPNDVAPLSNVSPYFTGNAVSQGGYLWAVHTVQGSLGNSAIRWYQIDEATGNVANTGDIENTDLDFTYPSIAINEFGAFAIGFSGSGVAEDQAASSYVTLGFTTTGLQDNPAVMIPQEPALLEAGNDNLINILNEANPFGEYSATGVDPDDPFSFVTFQNLVAASNTWGISFAEAGISGINPVIGANADANEIYVRRNAVNSDRIEFVFDGVVTDTFEIAAVDSYTLNLGDGDDTVTIDNSLASVFVTNGFTINAGGGQDTLRIVDSTGRQFDITGDGSGVVEGINFFNGIETIIGTDGDDIFTANNSATDWVLNGGFGNDIFDIRNSATGDYELSGMDGDDSYRIPLANFSMITILDSPNAENDSLVGLGTMMDDTLTLDGMNIDFNNDIITGFEFAGVENLDFDLIEGDDTFNIQALNANAKFFGNLGHDTFIVSSTAPDIDGDASNIDAELTINGGEGPNRLIVTGAGADAGEELSLFDITLTSDQIIGYTDLPILYAGDFGIGLDGGEGIELIGSDVIDTFNIEGLSPGNSVLVRGQGGNDIANVRSSATGTIRIDGESGVDTVRSTFAGAVRNVSFTDSGALPEERDRFSIRATDGNEELTIGDNHLNSLGEAYAWDGIENVVFDAMGGDDMINVSANQIDAIRVILNDGNDIGLVNGLDGVGSLRFDGLAGEDSFQFNSSVANTFVQALGGEGDDEFGLGANFFARSKVDGGEGDDDVSIVYASRDSRRVNARDTGEEGSDSLTVLGTPTADRIDLRPRTVDREGEIITYDENTEYLNVHLAGSNDIVNVFGTLADHVTSNLGVGNDTVNVFSTSSLKENVEFSFSLASGSDTTNIYRVAEGTRFESFGQSGDDSFNVGSTLSENDGNLNRIRGELFVSGGGTTDGFDTLQINDVGAGQSPFEYSITDRIFAHVPGQFNLNRPFDFFNYNGMEFIFANGTPARNVFVVQPSLEAIIRVDGNNGINDLGEGDRLSVIMPPGEAEVIDQFNNNGTGFFRFSMGFRNVSFQEIEATDVTSTDGFAVGLDVTDEMLAELLVDAATDV